MDTSYSTFPTAVALHKKERAFGHFWEILAPFFKQLNSLKKIMWRHNERWTYFQFEIFITSVVFSKRNLQNAMEYTSNLRKITLYARLQWLKTAASDFKPIKDATLKSAYVRNFVNWHGYKNVLDLIDNLKVVVFNP